MSSFLERKKNFLPLVCICGYMFSPWTLRIEAAGGKQRRRMIIQLLRRECVEWGCALAVSRLACQGREVKS